MWFALTFENFQIILCLHLEFALDQIQYVLSTGQFCPKDKNHLYYPFCRNNFTIFTQYFVERTLDVARTKLRRQ